MSNTDTDRAGPSPVGSGRLVIRDDLQRDYDDVYTAEALAALEALAGFNREVKEAMAARIERRARRFRNREYISFLDPDDTIPRTDITVRDARDGKFVGPEIPEDLKRQWIQGTGPGAKPSAVAT